MLLSRLVTAILSVGAMLLNAGMASSQNYPQKPIRIVTFLAGGGPDFIARLMVPDLMGTLGQPIVVDNRVAIIAIETAAKAPPDGYTLLLAGSAVWIGPMLQSMSYDSVRDFVPITLAERSANALVVHPSLPVKSVKDLIAVAKTRPGEFNYGATGIGSASHLAAELFKYMAGVNFVRVSYKGNAPAINDLVASQVHLMFSNVGPAMPYIKSGRLRGLAVSTAEPSALFPGLPTVAASGLPGYDVASMTAVFAPAKTRATIINQLNKEMVRILSGVDVKEKFLSVGMEAYSSSPEEFAARLTSEIAKWSTVIKAAGIHTE